MENIYITAESIDKNYWKDLWRYRELFYILSWRDLKVRYKQTILGVAWSVIRPVLTSLIFYIVFNRIARLESPGSVPYFLFVFAAMVPWQFFSNALSEASNSLIGNSNLISKIYFPRMIVPASSIVTSLVDLGISLIILIALFFVYQYVPDIKIILLPFFTLLALVTVLGVGLYITALNVKYRDFRYVIPFIIQLGLYITPVGFSSQVVPVQYRLWYSINPMVGVIDGFRWCLFNTPLYLPGLMASIVVSIGFLVLGIRYFRSTERGFADII